MDIDLVVIGLNSATTLMKCLQAAINCRYTKGKLHYYYIDGGSKDNSIDIAKEFPQFTILRVAREHPTPGAGRNMGWEKGSSPLVQFLDSDTEIHPDWLEKASGHLDDPEIAAVDGYLQELNPDTSIYNWICSHEWNGKPGFQEVFGGNVLVKRAVLEKTQGYDDDLVVGEDPELARRVRMEGWKILKIADLMATHDLNTQNIRKYLKRSYRTGYAFAAVYDRHHFWKYEVMRIVLRSTLFFACLIFTFIKNWLFIFPAFFFLFYPRLFRVDSIAKKMDLSKEDASLYSWHASLVVIPQFFGVIRYYYGKWFHQPLHNKSI